ncbi:sialidase family protein [Paenibacillus hodogayensis]|uniref:Sialidase family protein n=1 Tax=Paenibacillus hodogayensis TaxID=279208 RepID=A0ABV5VZK5_9BACL
MGIKPVDHMIVYQDSHYNAFPSVVWNDEGKLVAAFRQAPDRQAGYGLDHLDPSSKAVTVTSEDGVIWSERTTILYDDFFYGVQDPCLNVLGDGTVFATCFMWKVAEIADVPDHPDYTHKAFGRWAGNPVGSYTLRSADGGKTWDQPIAVDLGRLYIRGNCVEMNDGAILAPFYFQISGGWHVVVARTKDRGGSWERIANLEPEAGYGLFEPNLYLTPAGKLVLLIRCHKTKPEPGDGEQIYPLVTAESTDGGVTWSRPVKRNFFSPNPFHALRLRSGHMLLTYGYRSKPYGIRAVMLDPECENWHDAREIVIRDDGHGWDIGYTSAVQLKDGRVLIAYYYSKKGETNRYIASTICELE